MDSRRKLLLEMKCIGCEYRSYFMKIFILLFSFISLWSKTVYIVHIGGLDSSKYFYDYTFYRDEVTKPFVMLREAIERAGFDVKFTYDASNLMDVAAIISINDVSAPLLNNLRNYPLEKCFLLVMEPPIVLPDLHAEWVRYYFNQIFTLFDDPIDNQKYFKLYFPQPRLQMIENVPDFSQKKLCAMINGNKSFGEERSLYPERRKVIYYFTDHCSEFDLYGPDWHGYSAWRGYTPGKWETLKNYKFNFCYENFTNQNGYISEKIFDAMVAGCVPIYWGANNITDYIPGECFIDRRNFSSEAQLHEYMNNMDRATYETYIQAIRAFFENPKAQYFSSDYFVKSMLDTILKVN